MLNALEMEEARHAAGYQWVCGVDEAGRGPLAGPVCAAAVILPRGLDIEKLDDSKKLSPKRRQELYEIIVGEAVAWAVAMVDEKRIDEINILQATLRAMEEAVAGLSQRPDLALVDGNREPCLTVPCETIIGGDGKCAAIAAASVVAKVTRDRLMEDLDEQYPVYGFAVHKGYGTRRHYEALHQFGPCPVHRQSFLKKFYAREERAGGLG